MFRLGLILVCAALAVLVAGCCRERDAALDDVQRFVKHAERETDLAVIDIQRFVESNALITQ
ncbi:MAG TPA: hypothetical protein VHX44_15645, partial [Planctomycetota bacterium]|nr:hypothetical protein [Planctomycetota bacterium]